MLLIGIDPGKYTGVCVYDKTSKKIVRLSSESILRAVEIVREMNDASNGNMKVFVEDARKRRWFGDRSNHKLQGAGSIKRDCAIWEDFLRDLKVEYEMIAPQKGLTKLTAETFREITKWAGSTNEHNRDAAMIVWGR